VAGRDRITLAPPETARQPSEPDPEIEPQFDYMPVVRRAVR
jgi:hypothetical protein